MRIAIIPSFDQDENKWIDSLVNHISTADIQFTIFSEEKFWSGDKPNFIYTKEITLPCTFYQRRINDVYCCLYELSVGDYDIILNNTMLGNVPLSLLDTPIVIPFHPTFNVTESITPYDLQTKNTFLVATDPSVINAWPNLTFVDTIKLSEPQKYSELFSSIAAQ